MAPQPAPGDPPTRRCLHRAALAPGLGVIRSPLSQAGVQVWGPGALPTPVQRTFLAPPAVLRSASHTPSGRAFLGRYGPGRTPLWVSLPSG